MYINIYICNWQGDINCSSLPAGLGGNVEFERKFERKKIRMESAWEESPQFMSPWSWVWGGGQFHRQRHPKWRQKWPDMEFVTSGTSGTCVKYFWARVKFSKINSKLSLKFADSGFNFHKKVEWVCIWVDNCTKIKCMSKTSSILIFRQKLSRFMHFSQVKLTNLGISLL